jgi:hypothetical protein
MQREGFGVTLRHTVGLVLMYRPFFMFERLNHFNVIKMLLKTLSFSTSKQSC